MPVPQVMVQHLPGKAVAMSSRHSNGRTKRAVMSGARRIRGTSQVDTNTTSASPFGAFQRQAKHRMVLIIDLSARGHASAYSIGDVMRTLSRFRSSSPLLLALGLAVWTGQAQAVVVDPIVVPSAVGAGFVADVLSPTGTRVYGPTLDAITGGGTNAAGASFTNAASSLLVNGNPTASASGGAGTWAQAILDFYFVVSGPAGTQVPVNVTGTVSVSRPAGSTANLQAVISRADADLNPIDPMLFACFGTADPACSRGSGILTQTATISYSVDVNTTQAVFMFAYVDARTATSGNFSAFADPVVSIDPGFAHAADYRIFLSPGIAAAVPEPASGWSLAIGLLGLAHVVKRRRRSQSEQNSAGSSLRRDTGPRAS